MVGENYQIYLPYISACITKWVYKEFGAPLIKILILSPLYSPWKIINFDLLGGSNRRLLILLQSIQPTGLFARVIFKNNGEILFYNTNYAFDGWIVCAPVFFCFFFIKKIKRQARAKNDARFILFILLVKKLLLRTDAIPYSPIFI